MAKISNPVLSTEQAKKLIYRCMCCDKPIEAFYGVHYFPEQTFKGSCGRTCEAIAEARVKYPTKGVSDEVP